MSVSPSCSPMRTPTCRRIFWVLFSRTCTLIFPDFFLRHAVGLITPASRQAWREKIASCVIFFAVAGLFLFWIEYISTLSCDTDHFVEYDDVFRNGSHYVAVNGKAFEFSKYLTHPTWGGMATELSHYPGADASPLFPAFMMLDRHGKPTYSDARLDRCIKGTTDRSAKADAWLNYKLALDPGYLMTDTLVDCPYPNNTKVQGAPCYTWPDPDIPFKGDIIYDMASISNYTTLSFDDKSGAGYVVLNGKVLDVTAYLEAATNIVNMSPGINSRAFALDRMFLPLEVTMMLFINLGNDISDTFMLNITNAEMYEECLNLLFYKGVIQDTNPSGCKSINPALWATMGIGLLYFFLKMNLAHLCRLKFTSAGGSLSGSQPHAILMIPCYAEPSDILKQTFESLARSNYDDTKKMLLFVCDGVAQSRHDVKETHLCILELLGYSGTKDPESQSYISLGQRSKKVNWAKVYSGYYETGRNRVPYIVIVKTGNPTLINQDSAPGNRGKRDSMVLIFSFLERCMNVTNNRMTPLEYELFNQCYSVLGINPRLFKYMLVVDADMQVQGDVVEKLVFRLENDTKLLAISGHVRPANPEKNITTMLQIFPVYLTSYSGLAYEAFLDTVLSINGGLTMYKLWTENLDEPDIGAADSRSASRETISKWPKMREEIRPGSDPWGLNNDDGHSASLSSGHDDDSRLSLSHGPFIRPCCLHPSVLRGFAAAQPNTLHMQNVLLLGEEQYLAVVLLKSHPQHRLGFEPEAIGYATLPTNLPGLQAHQSRHMRSTLHNQLEMQRVAWSLGIGCWLVSISKLVDMFLSFPSILYLYSVYIRFFMRTGRAYTIIAFSFTILIGLHMLNFVVRGQFKYVIWFVFYALFSVPLFAVWFPIVAVWSSDHADRWYDMWPTTKKSQSRTHGIMDYGEKTRDVQENSHLKGATAQEYAVPRLRLREYERLETVKIQRRAMEEAAALDSNFTGFTGFVNNGRASMQSIGSGPIGGPVARSPAAVTDDRSSPMDDYDIPLRSAHRPALATENIFGSGVDDPFDDSYAVQMEERQGHRPFKHKPSHSQTSYFTYSTGESKEEDQPRYHTTPTRTAVPPAEQDRTESLTRRPRFASDQSSVRSMASSNLSLDPEGSLERGRYDPLSGGYLSPRGMVLTDAENEEGRSAALHSKVGLEIPDRGRGRGGGHRGPGYAGTPAPSTALDRGGPGRSVRRRRAGSGEASTGCPVQQDVLLPTGQDAATKGAIQREIRSFLEGADLNSITRAQVKEHLSRLFWNLQDEDFIHQTIEDITLEILSRPSPHH